LDQRLSRIPNGGRIDQERAPRRTDKSGFTALIELGKLVAVFARRHHRVDHVEIRRHLTPLEAGEPLENVGGPGSVIDFLRHGLAVFPVVDHIYAGGSLLFDHFRHRGAKPRRQCFGRRLVAVHRDEIGGAGQAARVGRQDSLGAALHGSYYA
jgi:hypothetical protein